MRPKWRPPFTKLRKTRHRKPIGKTPRCGRKLCRRSDPKNAERCRSSLRTGYDGDGCKIIQRSTNFPKRCRTINRMLSITTISDECSIFHAATATRVRRFREASIWTDALHRLNTISVLQIEDRKRSERCRHSAARGRPMRITKKPTSKKRAFFQNKGDQNGAVKAYNAVLRINDVNGNAL